jgi:hypothetical protein
VLLCKPLLGIPLPLSLSPVGYFLAASLALGSMPLAVAAVVFGAPHVAIGWSDYRVLAAMS